MDRDINKILELTKEIRIPLSVTFELTYNCNFNCVYCYQTPSKNRIQELSFFKITKILDVLKKNGCIYLKFTGGEPLIRKDFEEIYNYAYDRNFKISISSNGSLIDENYLNLLRKNKPELINISLYGATNKTYYNFTNTKNSWTITKNNILNLIKSNIKVNLKTVLNEINKHEISDMISFTNKYSIPFHVYTNVISYNDGNKDPKKLNVPYNEKLQYLRSSKINEYNSSKINCSVGENSISINPEGKMFLCPNVNEKTLSVTGVNFADQWNKVLELREKYILKKTPCSSCKYGKFSGICNPIFEREFDSSKIMLISKCNLCYKLYNIKD